MNADFVLRSTRVVLPTGVAPACVFVKDALISAVTAYDAPLGGERVIDCGRSVLMAGLVDPHVHINDPGRDNWEGFTSATRAAAMGGVTTLVDMPLNSIPATTSMEALEAKRNAALGKCWMTVNLWGGVVPGNASQLTPLWNAGVLGFKCFMVPSGVDEFPAVNEHDLRETMPILAELGAPLLVHAELPDSIEQATMASAFDAPRPQLYANYLRTRPRVAEHDAIALMIKLCREYGTRVHIVHLASADAVPMLRDARAEGLPITVETCPHYLTFCAEEIPDGATHFKCAPPIREQENRERLWHALGEGVIDFVASDHSPCPAEMKHVDTGDFLQAWGGIASLGLTLPVLWTGARRRNFSIAQIARWLSERPAEFCGIAQKKGRIAPGCFADLVLWNPEDQREWRGYHRMTPYAGEILYGVVEQTYLRGKLIYDHGQLGHAPEGHCGLHRTR